MDTLISELVKLVFAVAVVVLVPLAGAFAVRLLQKLGISIDAEKRAKLEKLAQDGILAAEEYAHAKIVAGVEKILPAAKLAYAVKHLLDQVPGISTEEAEALVNQELPKVRAATGDFLRAAQTKVAG